MSTKERIEYEFGEIKSQYPDLELTFSDKKAQIQGSISIVGDDGVFWDKFSVKLVLFSNYPETIPFIYEIGGRVPRKDFRHINEDGTCCLGPTIEIKRRLRRHFTLRNFMNEFVIPFFANQSYYEDNGFFASKEYSHGVRGTIEYYEEKFKTKDLSLVIKILESLVGHKKTGRNELCFCGSGEKFKKCHEGSWMEFDWLDAKQMAFDLRQILLFQKKEKESTEAEKPE